MRLVTVETKGGTCPAIVSADGSEAVLFDRLGYDFCDLNGVIRMEPGELRALYERVRAGSGDMAVPMASLTVVAPIIHPICDVICLGLNYKKHADEAESYERETFCKQEAAIYFGKHADKITAWNDMIPRYEGLVERLDYEAELGVIIGRTCRNVSERNARDYIFGYTVINDVSARDVQSRHKQWFAGKGMDGFLPMGPCVLTADEIEYPPRLKISSTVNGELRQNSTTDNMIHTIDSIISELSGYMTLRPGTVIATGTPEGVGMGMDPPCFLKKGDTVVCEIERIGRLVNVVG